MCLREARLRLAGLHPASFLKRERRGVIGGSFDRPQDGTVSVGSRRASPPCVRRLNRAVGSSLHQSKLLPRPKS
jgi:hypothetical protein